MENIRDFIGSRLIIMRIRKRYITNNRKSHRPSHEVYRSVALHIIRLSINLPPAKENVQRMLSRLPYRWRCSPLARKVRRHSLWFQYRQECFLPSRHLKHRIAVQSYVLPHIPETGRKDFCQTGKWRRQYPVFSGIPF